MSLQVLRWFSFHCHSPAKEAGLGTSAPRPGLFLDLLELLPHRRSEDTQIRRAPELLKGAHDVEDANCLRYIEGVTPVLEHQAPQNIKTKVDELSKASIHYTSIYYSLYPQPIE